MTGIPEADLLEHERQKLGQDAEDEPPEKMERLEETSSSSFAPPPIPFPFVPPVAGVMPYMPVPQAIPGG